MLVLSRKLNEEIVINSSIQIRLLKVGGGRVRLGISAPKEIHVRRAELTPAGPPNCPKREPSRTSGTVTDK